MTSFQIKNELEELIYAAINNVKESRNLLEEALTATDEIRVNQNDDENEKDIDALSSGLNDVHTALRALYNQVNDIIMPDVPEKEPNNGCKQECKTE